MPREGNSSVLVRFRLHFLLRTFQSLSLDLEEELLQRGIWEKLRESGISLAPYGTIVSAELTGEWVGETETWCDGRGWRPSQIVLNSRFCQTRWTRLQVQEDFRRLRQED